MHAELRRRLTALLADEFRNQEPLGSWDDAAEIAMDFFYGEAENATTPEADLGQDSIRDGSGTACCGGRCPSDAPDDGDPGVRGAAIVPMMVQLPTDLGTMEALLGIMNSGEYPPLFLGPRPPTEESGPPPGSDPDGSAPSAPQSAPGA